jgi:hypothetical protein
MTFLGSKQLAASKLWHLVVQHRETFMDYLARRISQFIAGEREAVHDTARAVPRMRNLAGFGM